MNTTTTEPTVNINGEQVSIPEARVLLALSPQACFGCYLGDDGPDTHDNCYLGRAVRELEEKPSVERYADRLVALIKADRLAEPKRYGNVASWEDLHGVCDANDYLQEADAYLLIDTLDLDDDFKFVNEAQTLAAQKLGWTEAS